MMLRLSFISLLALGTVILPPSTAMAETSRIMPVTKILNVTEIKAPEGAQAWLVEDKNVPVISISFSFDGGLIHDPDDKPGVAHLISTLLDEGAGDMKSQQFQKKLSDLAISMSFSAGRDAFTGEIKTLKDNKDAAFDLLHLALTKPRFDADAITRMKNANVSQIRSNMGDGSWLVARAFNGMLFENHFYSRPGQGDLVSMNTITRQDLLDYVAAQFARNVLRISIAGDITKEEAEAAVARIFGDLPATAEEADGHDVKLAYPGKTILFPLDTPQTYIQVAEAGIPRSDPDWAAAVIMNYILGGGSFDSRLMKEIRVKRGLTYGVYSGLSSMRYANMLHVSMSASNEKVAEALSIMKKEWARLASEGPTPAEVGDAQAYLTGSLLLGLASTDDISSTLNGLQQDHLDTNYINDQPARINAVTPSDVKRVAARLLKADDLTTVLVGKPTGINPDILLDAPPGMRETDNR